ncbi:GNAT family N-acetyltransferase [Clostridium perfringens]|nr:GNAT family N-acetyltransferase [Clostridium perfringens]
MKIKFIKASIEDSIYIKKIIDKCGKKMFLEEGLKHWMNPISINFIENNIKNKSVYLVLLDDEIVGTFTISRNDFNIFNDNSDKYLYLSKFAIEPSKNRMGIGKKCIEFCEALAIKKNLLGIRLDVYEKSYNAINFYKSNDFKELFFKNTTNFRVVCMEKLI